MVSTGLVHENKKALFDYEVIENFEAGIGLTGSEVKSVRAGSVNLKWSHVSISSGRPILIGAHISQYKSSARAIVYEPTRERELFLKKKDVIRLSGKVKEKGMTLIATRIYFKGTLVKVGVALVRGRTKHDKRDLLKNRTLEKEARKIMQIRSNV